MQPPVSVSRNKNHSQLPSQPSWREAVRWAQESFPELAKLTFGSMLEESHMVLC